MIEPTGTVLVAGSSGVVGYAALREFARQPGWAAIGLARRPRPVEGARLVPVDLTDSDATAAAVTSLSDVTHLVYAALFEKPGLLPGWYEQDQMDTNLAMLTNLLDPLLGVAPNLRHVSILQGTKAYGAHVAPMRLPAKEREPRHPHANFYWLQEDLLRERQAGADWTFTILRPQIIFGEAFGSNMNAIPALGVYAAVLRHDGRALDYPGGAMLVAEAVDADLVARALHWAAVTPAAANETFNVTNGDVLVIEHLWPAIADAFGMEAGERRPMSLAAEMPARQDTWTDLVRRFDLRSPVDLAAFVGQSFIYADLITGYGLERTPPPSLVSTIKIRHAGFPDCIDTEDMFRRLISGFQADHFLPPRAW
jgi:nucleoside-diphosphate-sugar epimerase